MTSPPSSEARIAQDKHDVVISLVETAHDLEQANTCLAEAFGRQAQDGVWLAVNAGWDTASGRAANAAKLVARWEGVTHNAAGDPNTIFVKATLPDPDKPTERHVVGIAIWQQLSYVPGQGDAFTGDVSELVMGLDEAKQRFATQVFASLWKRRIAYLREVCAPGSGREPPALFVLDMCAVHPAYQRRGIAGKLVEFGLEEARRRGDLECTTEGSAMGRDVYRRLGFRDEGVGDIQYELDEEFKDWPVPANVFLRTRA